MTDILVYDKFGSVVDTIFINDTLEHIDGRVSKGKDCYYKGVGVPYLSHHVYPKHMSEEYTLIKRSCIFYLGNLVSKKCFRGKTGIFQERYQGHFTDWIGACGFKELNILENLYDENKFEMSSIEVLGYEPIDLAEQQYYLKVQYHCGRKFYREDPNPVKLRELIDYLVLKNWNFPWDKNSISDISVNGLVTDVGDLFNSDELSHQVGTVYSILYSLGNESEEEYLNFCNLNGLRHTHTMDYILNTMTLLARNGTDINPLLQDTISNTYKHVVKNYLINGRNCGFCGVGSCKNRTDANESSGELIRKGYIKRVDAMLFESDAKSKAPRQGIQ